MKRTLTTSSLIMILIATSMTASAQFKIKKIFIEQGTEYDRVSGLSYSYFADRLPDDARASLRYADMDDGELYGGVCENPSLNLGVTLINPKLPNLEWRNGVNFMENRLDGVTYYDYDDNYSGDYVNVNGTHDEIALESSMHYRYSPAKWLNLYGGLGLNLGYTFNNEMCYYTSIEPTAEELTYQNAGQVRSEVSSPDYAYYSETNCLTGSNDITARGFYSIGASVTVLSRVELGLNIRKGLGYRANLGAADTHTNYDAVTLRAAWVLRD